MDQTQTVEALNVLRGELGKVSAALERNSRLLTLIEALERDKQKKLDLPIAKEIVISANDEWESPTVNNPEYNRARIFLDAGFTPAHSGGLSVVMIYKNSPLGEVMKVLSSNGSAGKASAPIDVAQISGFQFVLKNHDRSQSTTVKNFRIVLYKEDF